MEITVYLLTAITLFLIVDTFLDNYYFNGTKKGAVLILNRHLFYEIIQIALLTILVIAQLYYLPNLPWYSWIFPVIYVFIWCIRIYTTYKNRNCEIQIGNNKVVYINHNGETITLENPNYFSLDRIDSQRITLSSQATDIVATFKNEKKEELTINLHTNSLDAYATQIYKTATTEFNLKQYDGIVPGKYLNLKNLSILLFVLIVISFGIDFFTNEI